VTDLAVLYACTVGGLATLLVGWWGVSGTARLSHQVPWVVVGTAGLIVLGAGNGLWLLIGRRAVAERRRSLLGAFAAAPLTASTHRNGAGPKPVWATGMQRYHRPTCQLVAGKATRSSSISAHHRAGRQPCGMCQP
jgi:hypothetical protein